MSDLQAPHAVMFEVCVCVSDLQTPHAAKPGQSGPLYAAHCSLHPGQYLPNKATNSFLRLLSVLCNTTTHSTTKQLQSL